MKILTGELTTNEAAAQAGVDRSTVLKLRKVAKDGAIAALGASRPGRHKSAVDGELVARGGDQRGIALQTIIIMVVLLAIAGSVAAVLLTRAGDVTSQLESQRYSQAWQPPARHAPGTAWVT